jgi:hypothetical protein
MKTMYSFVLVLLFSSIFSLGKENMKKIKKGVSQTNQAAVPKKTIIVAKSPEEMQSLLDEWQKKVNEAKEKVAESKRLSSSRSYIDVSGVCICAGYKNAQSCCKKEEQKIFVL